MKNLTNIFTGSMIAFAIMNIVLVGTEFWIISFILWAISFGVVIIISLIK